jgi:hypothetical protein
MKLDIELTGGWVVLRLTQANKTILKGELHFRKSKAKEFMQQRIT